MADRVVSVKLEADVTQYMAATAKASAATKALGSTADASSRSAKDMGDKAAESTRKVGLSADDATKRLAGVRTELARLGGTKVGADTVAARTELARLSRQLKDISTAEANPRVDAGTAAAHAQLRALQTQLDRIDGQNVRFTVDADTGRASANLNGLMAAALAVSPALGTIGAVAAAGLGAIAPLAASAAAGLGVLAVGFSGVADAVKLLDQRQESVATTAAKGATTQVNSAQQVASAQASLANARANAASSAVRATEQVADAHRDEERAVRDAADGVAQALRRQEDAERRLTHEQRDQRRAQLDLLDARKEAQQQLEDLSASVEENALAQRQAVLDVADARKALDEALTEEGTTDEAREQARIDYEEAALRQQQLTRQGRRLAAEREDANRRGVEGSELVVDAQQRVAAADESVVDAARTVGDATAEVDRARTEGAEKVAEAQRQVAAAVRDQADQQRQAAFSVQQAQAAVAAAMASSGAAGVSALAGIDAKLAEVGPSTLAFAEFVDGTLQPAWERLQETAAAGLLPGVRAGLESLLGQEPRITRFVDTYARSLGNLSRDSLVNLTNPQWRRFFDMLETQGVPQLQSMWRSGDNLAESFASILVAFAPLATDLAQGIEGLTEDFATWSSRLADSEGFHEFEAYVRENWPKVRDIIWNVAQVVGRLIEAGAPIGSGLLTGFELLSDVLSGLPVGVVQALLVAFLGYQAVTGATEAVTGFVDQIKAVAEIPDRIGSAKDAITGMFGGAADAAGGAADAVEKTSDSMDRAEESTDRAGGAAERTAGKTSRMGRAFEGANRAATNTMNTLGGPWGVALAGAGIIMGIFQGEIASTQAQMDQWADAMVRGGQGAKDAIAAAEAEYNSYNDNIGGRIGRQLDVWAGITPDPAEVRQRARDAWEAMSPLAQAQTKVAEWQDTLNRRRHDGASTAAEVEAAERRLTYWTGQVSGMQGELDGATRGTNAALEVQKRTLEDLTGAHVDTSRAEADFYAATDRARTALEGMSGSVLDSSGKLNLQSEAGRAAQDVLFAVAEVGNRLTDTMIKHGATTDEVTAKDAQLRESFIKSAGEMGIGRQRAEELANQIYGIPAERKTTITADVQQAQQAIGDVQAAIGGLTGKQIILDVIARANAGTLTAGQAAGLGFGYAGGGYTGDGGKYDPAGLVHRGEYVVTKERTARLGLHRLENLERILPGYADGGIVLDIEPRMNPEALDQLGRDLRAAALTNRPGAGRLGDTWGSIWQAVKTAIPEARMNSTYRPGDPGYHGRNKAIDFGFGSVPGGAGSPGLAAIARFLYRGYGQTLAELIYDGVGDDTPDVKNGRDHTYNLDTQRDHAGHVHAAVYHDGTDFVARTGMAYLERGEAVVPAEVNARSREFPGGYGTGGGGSVVTTDARSYPITVTAGPSAAEIARAIRESQRDLEFLHG